MGYVRGEEHAVGVAVETTRGTFLAATDYVRTREPASVQTILERADIKETKATGVASQGQVITMKKVEGDMPLNLRFRTIGYFLKSLLGGVSSALEAGESAVWRHTITLATAILQPTLSLSLARGAFPHLQIPGAVVTKLGLNFPLNDLINGSVSIKALSETSTSNFTPAFGSTDYNAPHQIVTLKVAADVASLGAASPVVVTDMKIELSRDAKEKLSIASVSPLDFYAKLLAITGTFTMDKQDDTYKNLAIANTNKAMSISVINSAQTIGIAAHPEITFTLPNVTFITKETRPLDDVVTEEVQFIAHYDDTAAKAITVSLVNEKSAY